MALAEQPRDARERLEMIGAGALWGEQQEHDVDGLAVHRVEIDGLGKARADSGDALQPDKLAVRNGNALAEASRAKPLTLEQRIEDIALLEAR